MTTSGLPPLRVEQVLRLLPDVDALAPLRAFLVSTSHAEPRTEPHLTVGKRHVQPADLRELMPQAVSRVSDHLSALYEAALDALESEQRGDLPAAVRALLRAGDREHRVGRTSQARAWYDHAARIAETLRDRRPEIETLLQLGRLELQENRLEEASRYYQRAHALADAEQDQNGIALACQGLGECAVAKEQWKGAESWYSKGLRAADQNRLLSALLNLGLADVSMRRDQLEAMADRLRTARQLFESAGHLEGTVRVLNAWGQLEARRGRRAESLASYIEALAELEGAGGNPKLEVSVRLNMSHLYLDWGRLVDAEDEIRKGEETAIVHNFTQELCRLYLIMGRVRGLQGDDTGFVFFEKAVELCRGTNPNPKLEAESYLAYGKFREGFGDREEARAYYERAREILESLTDGPSLERVDAELARIRPA